MVYVCFDKYCVLTNRLFFWKQVMRMLGRFNVLKKIDLKRLIFLLAFLSVVVTLGNSLYATYKVQKTYLINDTLESNRVYATKLAETTEHFLHEVLNQLRFSAQYVGSDFTNSQKRRHELSRLMGQSTSFNSVVIVDSQGRVMSTQPESLNLDGYLIENGQATIPLNTKAPYISTPFVSPIGNLIISVSSPIFGKQGRYLGYIGGSIYLQGDNILSRLLGEHHYLDGSYLYVIDQNKKLVYHMDKEKIGTELKRNQIVDQVLSGFSGTMVSEDTPGTHMLSGYAAVPIANWGIVAQRPLKVTLAQLNNTLWSVIKSTLPITVVTLFFILVFGSKIALPLWKLANGVKEMDRYAKSDVQGIKAWYFEAAQLKQAIMSGTERVGKTIREYDLDRQKDPLTQLLNRRGMLVRLEHFKRVGIPFSVIALDIDHFKAINDEFGHAVGDEVIRTVAELMLLGARDRDVICRTGGEEFSIYLPDVNIQQAYHIAERLRNQIAKHAFCPVTRVNVSLGVAHWPNSEYELKQTLQLADQALYKAKRNGRNRTELLELEPV